MAFTGSGLHKSLKERDIHNSRVFQTSGFLIFTIIWSEKMAIMKTFYCRIEVWGFLLIF